MSGHKEHRGVQERGSSVVVVVGDHSHWWFAFVLQSRVQVACLVRDSHFSAQPVSGSDAPYYCCMQANKQQHLLSFVEEQEDQAAATLPKSDGTQHQPAGGMGQATAAKFRAEARQAAAARFVFHPSGGSVAALTGELAAAGNSQQQEQRQHPGLVDEDAAPLRLDAPAGLSQVHFGMAQVGGNCGGAGALQGLSAGDAALVPRHCSADFFSLAHFIGRQECIPNMVVPVQLP